MKNAELEQLDPIDRLVYWAKERHQIYLKKEAGLPPPWSDNETLQAVFFCNVYRELDKVSTFLRENIRDPLKDSEEVIFATIAFRWFNFNPTGQILIDNDLLVNWDCQKAVEILTAVAKSGEKVFTGAFNISNSGSRDPKVNRVCEGYIQPVWEQREMLISEFKRGVVEGKSSLEEAHELLMDMPGLRGSGFMAAQVVADLKFTWCLQDAHDWWSWCCLGPGSKRGLNRIHHRPKDGPVPDNWMDEMIELQETLHRRLPRQPRFCLQDCQSVLCETDKFLRAMAGDGHVKRSYPGVYGRKE